MKRSALTLVFTLVACIATAGGSPIVVERSNGTNTYQFAGKTMTLTEIQRFFKRANDASRARHPKLSAPQDVIVVGSESMEALVPLFVCLKQAGQLTCTHYLLQKHDGKDWRLQANINLKDLFNESGPGWLKERLRFFYGRPKIN